MLKLVLIRLARTLAFLSLGLGVPLLMRVRSTAAMPLLVLKLLAGSVAGFLAAAGLLGAALGLLLRQPATVMAGVAGAVLAGRYVLRATARHAGFQTAFGPGWESRLSPEQRSRMLQRRRGFWLRGSGEPRWERDVPFWTIAGGDRRLLCDIWRPPRGVDASGLAFIYNHGGAWHYLDKGLLTRPLFRHLAARGHTVMDVAYRLAPEVDVFAMQGDVKRAVAWMKSQAAGYDVDPGRIVLAGGSAGGHLALLAAYTPTHPRLRPDDLGGVDTSVRAAVSFYGPVDARACYEHAGAVWPRRQRALESKGNSFRARVLYASMEPLQERLRRWLLSREELAMNLLGGLPDQVPELCELASPLAQAGPHCPPTLLFQGEHDCLAPAGAARALARKLTSAGVPVVYVELPQTEHAFDLFLPRISPPAQAALYDLERFLALMA